MVALSREYVSATTHRAALDRIEDLEEELRQLKAQHHDKALDTLDQLLPRLRLTVCQAHIVFTVATGAPELVSFHAIRRSWPTGNRPDRANLHQQLRRIRAKLDTVGARIMSVHGRGLVMTLEDAAKVLRS